MTAFKSINATKKSTGPKYARNKCLKCETNNVALMRREIGQ